jgi:hypothetical protein
MLGAAAAAPLVLQLLRGPGPAVAAVAPAAAAGPRFLTPEQQAAVNAAFAATLPKSEVRSCGQPWWCSCGQHMEEGLFIVCA